MQQNGHDERLDEKSRKDESKPNSQPALNINDKEEKADEQHAATESQNIPQQLPPSVTACIPADPADD